MQAVRSAVGLSRGASNVDVGCRLSEEWRFDIESRVPLAECVMYLVGRKGWPKVEGIIAVVGVVVGDEGGKVGVVVYDENRDGVVYSVG